MTFIAEGPVASGRQYLVTSVNGRRPEGLDEFTGSVEITLLKDDTSLSLVGEGTRIEGGVHLCQKERGPIDRDVRVWNVTEQGQAKFTAEPLAVF